MLYGKSNEEAAHLAGTPAYANHFQADGQKAVNGDAPWITGQQTGAKQAAPSPEDGREGPLNIFWRGQKPYEEARVGRIFNLRRPERFPAAVLNAHSVNEVVRGVKLAAERGLKIAIRSGGHSWAGLSVRNKSILIDLGNLKELSYDSATRIVTVSPSTTGGELNPYLARWGRFFGGGHCPTVGLGGFLLQGGQGWGARGWGWACEQIDSMDVVLANGDIVTCSESVNSDLFWAARGAGPGFFGVVVRFRLRTRPIPLAMHHTTVLIPAKGNFEACSEWWFKVNRTLDPLVESVLLSFSRKRLFPDYAKTDPTANPLDAIMVMRGTYLGDDEDEAREALAPLLQCPVLDNAIVKVVCASTSMAQEYEQQLADNPPARYFLDNAWVHGEDKDVVQSLKAAYDIMPSEESFFLIYSMAPLRPLPDMAFDIQSEHYAAGYIINKASEGGDDQEGDQRCQEWLKTVFSGLDERGGKSGGTIGQYTGDTELTRRPSKFMSDEHWSKFCEIKKKYDPNDSFSWYMNVEGYQVNEAARN
ncbi:FAD-binding domain-containing protein [Cystobasidium minutum MCA 4210]|uniref:FAD-binding domain-containing protein n=1 Tax=Cystobasidium minutum MCA 4210 TaxID=1397322 RepID=UPI0034CF746A|eukprot:jgi/Rhomi1/207153/estExt_Genemark1.C_1_t10016